LVCVANKLLIRVLLWYCRTLHVWHHAGGALSGKYLNPNPDPKARFNLFKGYMERYNKSLARDATEEYVKLAQKYNLTPTQLALAWCR
jgi:aryl-alcohol dehydrogenase-like predicted oxidoreductase